MHTKIVQSCYMFDDGGKAIDKNNVKNQLNVLVAEEGFEPPTHGL